MKFIYGVLASVIEFVWGVEGAGRRFDKVAFPCWCRGRRRKPEIPAQGEALYFKEGWQEDIIHLEIRSYPSLHGLVFYRIIYCRELRASSLPSSLLTTTNLGTEHTTTNAHALLLMDSSLMKYLDESARIYCAPARPALSRIVHDKPALISIPETFHRSPLKTTTPDRPLYRFLFPPVPATSIARRVEYSH